MAATARLELQTRDTLLDTVLDRLERADGGTFDFLDAHAEETDGLSLADGDSRARATAAVFPEHTTAGDRAIVLCPPGPDYLTAFVGCVYAGVVAVPAYPTFPGQRRAALPAIVASCEPTLAIGTTILRGTQELEMPWLDADAIDAEAAGAWRRPELTPSSIAFLQYTSGSTGDRRCVSV